MARKNKLIAYLQSRGGGGLPYERDGDARRKFWIKPLKETNLGVAQPLKAIILNFDHMTRANKTNWKYTIF